MAWVKLDGEARRSSASMPPVKPVLVTRLGTADDLDPARNVIRAAAEARDGVAVAAPVMERTDASLTAGTAFLVVAEEAGELVGVAVTVQALAHDGHGPPIPGLAHVSAVFVVPERWGQGIGQALLDLAMEHARAQAYDRAQLWTHVDNQHARALYEGKGFVASGREQELDGQLIMHYERAL